MNQQCIGVRVKNSFLLVFILILTSCSSTAYNDSDIDKISIDMGVLNQRLVGYLYRKELKKDLRSLDKDIYVTSALKIKDPSEVEYTNLLKKDGVVIQAKGMKADFVVCVKDLKPLLVLCDKASTPFVEKVIKNKNLNLGELIKEL